MTAQTIVLAVGLLGLIGAGRKITDELAAVRRALEDRARARQWRELALDAVAALEQAPSGRERGDILRSLKSRVALEEARP